MANRMFSLTLIALLMLARSAGADASQTLTLVSGPERVTLLELYTSEGCSSCPPADRWMSRLKREPDLWRRFVPVAFHVDYWDYIGWKDRFSDPSFSDRQRRYAQQGGARAVYTPGFFTNGQEWRQWPRDAAPTSDGAPAGDLRVEISAERVHARFAAAGDDATRMTVHVAVVGMDIKTEVGAGENRGKTLHHDFVALGVRSAALTMSGTTWSAALDLPEVSVDAEHRALVAWVTRGDRQAPVQAVGGRF